LKVGALFEEADESQSNKNFNVQNLKILQIKLHVVKLFQSVHCTFFIFEIGKSLLLLLI